MCGIVGILAKNGSNSNNVVRVKSALHDLRHRGPDAANVVENEAVVFGHARLSIIDTSIGANQPFVSEDKEFTLVFNGEIYNFKELKTSLEKEGIVFKTNSDTEVLFKLLILKGKDAINELDGFFAFAFFSNKTKKLLLARDRMGIKPLLIYQDDEQFIFGSELSVFNHFELKHTLNKKGLNSYLGLTYIPAPESIYTKVSKLNPGEYLELIAGKETRRGSYYLPKKVNFSGTYEDAKNELNTLLSNSVKNRLVSDVPLGCFLSGGLDSSIIAALAIQQKPNLKTFSIGFDHPFFDEASFATELANHINSDHQVYTLTKADFKNNFESFLNAIDEPFADSSAFAVFLLSKYTKEQVTVALSGDGADEMFGGYRKHYAEFKIQEMNSSKKAILKAGARVFKSAKSSRSDKWGDLNRKLQKLAGGIKLSSEDRYWQWCNFVNSDDREKILHPEFYQLLLNPIVFGEHSDGNEMLKADQSLVLPNDMLKKVDLMSMANGLEVRTPFLDHKVVEFVNNLPFDFKISKLGGKRILKDTFKELLPESVLNRPKRGFEIPIRDWLGDEINELLKGELFNKGFIEEQKVFSYSGIQQLIKDWNQPDFGDRIYLIWELIVFQHWWRKNQHNLKK